MELKLIKTTGGGNGRPPKCKCGDDGFVRQGHGWACLNCSLYFPTDLARMLEVAPRLAKFVRDERHKRKDS